MLYPEDLHEWPWQEVCMELRVWLLLEYAVGRHTVFFRKSEQTLGREGTTLRHSIDSLSSFCPLLFVQPFLSWFWLISMSAVSEVRGACVQGVCPFKSVQQVCEAQLLVSVRSSTEPPSRDLRPPAAVDWKHWFLEEQHWNLTSFLFQYDEISPF